jgi:hypothetical protein
MDARVALTIGSQRKKLPLASHLRYLSQGIIGNRSFGSASNNDILLPAVIKFLRKRRNAKQTNPKKWKFDEIP